MRKIISFIILYILLIGAGTSQTIDWSSQIPVDPKLRIGKLENGLTYYIRANNEPKGKVSFHLVNDVGAVLEEDNEDGLAHFLEHMAFNGTKNFPGRLLVDYLQSIGLKPGRNLNAYTAREETVYSITDVPTHRQGIIDSVLLALNDWASNISLNEQDIDNERNVIREEWRTGRNFSRRLGEQLMNVMYLDTRYSTRNVIGDTAVINNFEYNVIREFYKRWYRPDLQAIIAVGDFDVDNMERLITERFSSIPKHHNPSPRPNFTIPKSSGPRVGIATDPEAMAMQFSIAYSYKNPREKKSTLAYLKQKWMNEMIARMLQSRYSELRRTPETKLASGNASFSSRTRDEGSFYVSGSPKGKDLVPSIKELMAEVYRVMQHGFTNTELERVKVNILRSIENSLNEKHKIKNNTYARGYVDHFLQNNPIDDIEQRSQSANVVIPSISIKEINSHFNSLVSKNNSIITVSGASKDKEIIPNEEQLLSILAETELKQYNPYFDDILDKPLVSNIPKGGEVVSVKKGVKFNTTEWELSNGIKVVLKETEHSMDEILMKAFSPGGLSLASTCDLPSATKAVEIVTSAGVGDFTSNQLGKALAGKSAGAGPYINNLHEGFNGSAKKDDFETMLQLVYLYFTHTREDVENFETRMSNYRSSLLNASYNPKKDFRDSLIVTLTNQHPRVRLWDIDYLNNIDYQKALAFYKDRFSDASDFTFIFVGNINQEQVEPLIENYLGALPSTSRKEKAIMHRIMPPKGNVKKHFNKPLSVSKATIQVVYSGEAKYSLENSIITSIIENTLTKRCMEEIREKEGATYGVGVRATLQSEPFETLRVSINFDTDPKLADKMIEIVHREVKLLVENGPSYTDFNNSVSFILKQFEQQLNKNSYWMNVLNSWYMSGEDINTTYIKTVNGITPQKVQKLAKKFFSQENVIELVMFPLENH